MNQLHFDEPVLLVGEVAARFLELIEDVQAAGEVPHVALTGGTIADQIHHELGRVGPTSGVDWGAVDFWFGDERFVAADSPDRNAGLARSAFLDVVGATRVHEAPADDGTLTLEEAAASYAAQIRASGGAQFALVMLGMGPDGHVASLFPGHPGMVATDTITVPVADSPKPPPARISLSLEALNRSRQVWFVVAGEEKRAAADEAVTQSQGALKDRTLPAAMVHGSDATLWFRCP